MRGQRPSWGGCLFLSTLSLRRATPTTGILSFNPLISIHALLAESDCFRCCAISCITISIHALLAESDRTPTTVLTLICISIHALLAESDADKHAQPPTQQDFYPRSPCGERPKPMDVPQYQILISIHALLAESDYGQQYWRRSPLYFYPRSPCGERQQAQSLKIPPLCISIHALLAESDAPQPPQGESSKKFLSTLSLRRATR